MAFALLCYSLGIAVWAVCLQFSPQTASSVFSGVRSVLLPADILPPDLLTSSTSALFLLFLALPGLQRQ